MTNQFMTYEKYNSNCSYAVIKYNSYTKATIDILAKYNSVYYARLYAEKNNAIVVRIADLVVVDKGYYVYSHGNVLMVDKAIALNAQFAKQWELTQGELSDSVNRYFATNKVANEAIIGESMDTFPVVEDLIEYYAELPIMIDESLLTVESSEVSYSNRDAVNHEDNPYTSYEVDWDKGNLVAPDAQNEAKITNLQASTVELASLPDTDTDTVKVAIEIANFITNYFGYVRPIILVKDNVATLRYVDTLQLQFNLSVTIVGNIACISELTDTDTTKLSVIVDYLLNRFTSKVVKSIALARYQPIITNLARPTGKFWDNVKAIPFDDSNSELLMINTQSIARLIANYIGLYYSDYAISKVNSNTCLVEFSKYRANGFSFTTELKDSVVVKPLTDSAIMRDIICLLQNNSDTYQIVVDLA